MTILFSSTIKYSNPNVFLLLFPYLVKNECIVSTSSPNTRPALCVGTRTLYVFFSSCNFFRNSFINVLFPTPPLPFKSNDLLVLYILSTSSLKSLLSLSVNTLYFGFSYTYSFCDTYSFLSLSTMLLSNLYFGTLLSSSQNILLLFLLFSSHV